MKQASKDWYKVIKVLNSCRNIEEIYIADKMRDNYYRMYNISCSSILLDEYFDARNIKLWSI